MCVHMCGHIYVWSFETFFTLQDPQIHAAFTGLSVNLCVISNWEMCFF